MVPAVGSYGRAWEKVVAGFMSLFVLVALVLVGVLLGILIVYNWPDIQDSLP